MKELSCVDNDDGDGTHRIHFMSLNDPVTMSFFISC